MDFALDAGHFLTTAGKRSPDGRYREFHFNKPVAEEVGRILQTVYGCRILYTHSDSRDVPLGERTGAAREWGVDAFISIHTNAMGSQWQKTASGIETFIHDSVTDEGTSFKLAAAVQTELIRDTGMRNRSVKRANFAVLRHMARVGTPAILVECGFHDNADDLAKIMSDAYRHKVAAAIAFAVADAFGLKRGVQIVDVKNAKGDKIAEGEVRNGVTWVPLRVVAEATGATVNYDKIKGVTVIPPKGVK